MTVPLADDAEDRVIGSMIDSPACIPSVLDVLEPGGAGKFYKASHGKVYSLVHRLWAEGKPIDLITVSALVDEDLRDRIMSWVYGVTSTANVAHHAELVRDAWAARMAVDAGNRIIAGAEEDPYGIVSAELARVESLVQGKVTDVVEAGELARELFMRMQEDKREDPGIPAPLPGMPRFRGGRVYVIAGYTAHGKTILGAQIARTACEYGRSVTFHALEMSKEDQLKRILATFGVPYGMLDREDVDDRFVDKMVEGMAALDSWKLRIIDDPAVGVADVKRFQRGLKSDMIIFDHLHRMRLPGKVGERRFALEDACRDFVNLAKTEDVPVVLLAQLSRPNAGIERRPVMSDLRETSIIEQEAAGVGFIWRRRDDDDSLSNEGEYIQEKDRFGRSGVSFRAVFDPRTMMFTQPGGNF